jgi:AcrR family transcriptional regulator
MPSVKRPSGRRRGGVTVDDVVAAAIDIVDREGVDALTIRRVAEACGLSPMGLYGISRPAAPGTNNWPT